MTLVPAADEREQGRGGDRAEREPGDAGLAARHDDEGDEQRADGCARFAADLEERLSETVAAAGCEPGDARGFRMEYGRADADEGRGEQDRDKAAGHRKA